MVVTAQALHDIFTGFNLIFQEQYQAVESIYPKYAMVVNSDSDKETYGWLDAIPGLRKWIGDRQYHDIKQQGQTLTNEDYENTVWLKRTDIEDDKLGLYNNILKQVANNVVAKKEYEALKQLIDGFSKKGYDGQNFFSASHKWQGKNTSNILDIALSDDNFNTAVEMLYNNVATIGQSNESPIMMNLGFTLIVGSKLRATAMKIVERSTNDLGADNINKGAAELIIHPFINGTAEKYWFLIINNNPIKPVIFQNRIDVETTWVTDSESDLVFNRNAYAFGIRSRFTTGYGLPQLAIGSTGSN